MDGEHTAFAGRIKRKIDELVGDRPLDADAVCELVSGLTRYLADDEGFDATVAGEAVWEVVAEFLAERAQRQPGRLQ